MIVNHPPSILFAVFLILFSAVMSSCLWSDTYSDVEDTNLACKRCGLISSVLLATWSGCMTKFSRRPRPSRRPFLVSGRHRELPGRRRTLQQILNNLKALYIDSEVEPVSLCSSESSFRTTPGSAWCLFHARAVSNRTGDQTPGIYCGPRITSREQTAGAKENFAQVVGLAILLSAIPNMVLLWCGDRISENVFHRNLKFSQSNLTIPFHDPIFSRFTSSRSTKNGFLRDSRILKLFRDMKHLAYEKYKRAGSRLNDIWFKLNLNDEEICPVAYLSKFISYPYPQPKLARHLLSITSQTVQLSLPRLASYQQCPTIHLPDSASFAVLAQAGFKYTGRGSRVQCEGCGSAHDIHELSQSPASAQFHAAGCQFVESGHGSDQSTPAPADSVHSDIVTSPQPSSTGVERISSSSIRGGEGGPSTLLAAEGSSGDERQPSTRAHDAQISSSPTSCGPSDLPTSQQPAKHDSSTTYASLGDNASENGSRGSQSGLGRTSPTGSTAYSASADDIQIDAVPYNPPDERLPEGGDRGSQRSLKRDAKGSSKNDAVGTRSDGRYHASSATASSLPSATVSTAPDINSGGPQSYTNASSDASVRHIISGSSGVSNNTGSNTSVSNDTSGNSSVRSNDSSDSNGAASRANSNSSSRSNDSSDSNGAASRPNSSISSSSNDSGDSNGAASRANSNSNSSSNDSGDSNGAASRPNSSISSSSNDSVVFVSGSKYVSDSELMDKAFYGMDQFETEFCQERQKPFRAETLDRGNCRKNPGHFCYRSVARLEENLPDFATGSVFSKFMSLFSDLTVRVVVSHTSAARGEPEPSQTKQPKYRTGTGSAIVEPRFEDGNPIGEGGAETQEASYQNDAESAPHSKSKTQESAKTSQRKSRWSIRKYTPSLKKRPKSTFYIETNRHLVFDNAEAVHTTVEFFFDRPDRSQVYSFKVSRVIHDGSLRGGNRSFLVCKTTDHSFVQNMRAKREQLEGLVRQFPEDLSEEVTKRVFLVHHPHGGEKVYCYSNYVIIRYLMEWQQGSSPSSSSSSSSAAAISDRGDGASAGAVAGGYPRLTKIRGFKQLPRETTNLRKFLFYSADTCPGSSGAPVISFTRTGSDVSGAPNLRMTVWMHEGREIVGALNVSTMEACTAADLVPPPKRTTPVPALTLPMPGPIVRMGDPAYPAYATLQKRLESYGAVPHQTFVHSTAELAKGGFFYAGYADCVRCFYCGLGLRQWRQGDDPYSEHERLRPGCHFLILQLRVMGETRRAQAAARAAAVATSVGVAAGTPSLPAVTAAPVALQQAAVHRPLPSSSKNVLSAGKTAASLGHGVSKSGKTGLKASTPAPHPGQQNLTVFPVFRETQNARSQGSDGSASGTTTSATGASNKLGACATTKEQGGVHTTDKAQEHTASPSASNVTSSLETSDRVRMHLLQTENALLQRALTCKVCNSEPARSLYLPCGHMDSCEACTHFLSSCPTCTTVIQATVNVFFG